MDKLLKIELTRSEKDAILKIPGLDPEIPRRLQVTTVIGNSFTVRLAPEKVRGLAARAAAKAAEGGDLQKTYKELQGKLEKTLKG
jgi:hypothetical protein